MLRLRVLGKLERAVRNDNPRRTTDGRLRARIVIDDALRRLDRRAVLLHFVHVISGRPEDVRGVFVLRERVGKFERACDRIALGDILLLAAGSLQLLAVCVDCRVARACRPGVRRVAVGRPLVLLRRLAEIMVLQQKVRQLIVDRRRLGVLRE